VRWFLLAIVAYAAVVVQATLFVPGGLALSIHDHWTRPDLVLIVGVFVALYYRPLHTYAAAWGLGLAADLVTVTGRLGLQALLFCAVLTGLSSARRVLNRGWVLTQSVVTFAAVLAVHAAWYAAARYLGGAPPDPLRSLEQAALDAAYSGILAPYVIWLLLRLRGPLGVLLEPSEM